MCNVRMSFQLGIKFHHISSFSFVLNKSDKSVLEFYNFNFLLQQELKVSQCPSVCPSGTSLSKALNLHLSSL